MSWLPAITVLLLVNAAALAAIAFAGPIRRLRLRAVRAGRAQVAAQIAVSGIGDRGAGKADLTTSAKATVVKKVGLYQTRGHETTGDHGLTAARLLGERGEVNDVALIQILATLDETCGRLLVASRSARHVPPPHVLMSIAAGPEASSRVFAIRLLGAYVESRSRRALVALLADPDARIRGEAAAALAASARLGYPNPLDPALVSHLIEMLGRERSQAVIVEIVEALTYSLDPQVPAALVRLIPSSNGAVRERLVEANAVVSHLRQPGTRGIEAS